MPGIISVECTRDGLLLIAFLYHENVIRAGFSASGSRKWLAATVAMGRMATKSVIRQSCGINGATANMTMPAMAVSEKSMENLN